MVRDGRGISVRLVLGVGVVVAALSWIGLRLWTDGGHGLPDGSWASAVLLLFMAVGIYFAGLPVRRWQRGESAKPLSMMRAMRTLVLAQAAALTGAAVAGWYAAQVIVRLPDFDVASVRQDTVRFVVLLVAGVALSASGLAVQRMCRIDDDSHDEDHDRES
jgi:hypothetical protein